MPQNSRKSVWTVNIDSKPPFTMGGIPMTKAEALETCKSIWPKAKTVRVS